MAPPVSELCYICSSPAHLKFAATTRPEDESYAITENRTGRHGNVLVCENCRLWMLPEAERAAFAAIPSRPDETYLEEENGRRKAARRVLEELEKLAPKGKLLDIGSSTGFFLSEAKYRGWRTKGIEFSSWSKKIAEERFELEVYAQPLEELNWPKESFDAVAMLDVIEHLTNPRQVLREVAKILKPEGTLVLTTPNCGSHLARWAREKWYAVLPGHLFYFSPTALAHILEETGFRVIRKKTHARYFSLAYFFYRLGGYLPFLEGWGKKKAFKNLLLKLNFGDEFEWYAKKTG
jgi:2-polyprenyl-3-methyl-5-hydroxy-6-metoxy-1,4-benzoquinol methylase